MTQVGGGEMVKPEVKGLVGAGELSGLVTRAVALGFLSEQQLRTRLQTGAWVRLLPSVYRVVGAPVTWRQHLEALLLWAGKGAVLSHRTAAALHGLNSFKEGPLELTCSSRVRAPEGVHLHHVSAVPACDRTEVDDLRVTNATRTLVDLAATTDPFTLRAVLDQALREKKTTLEKLAAAAKRAKNRPGVIDLRELLREFNGEDGPTESELERLCLEVIAAAGLAKPRLQWALVAGRRRRRLDLFFDKQGVVVEADGYASHSGIEAFEDDRERNNSLTILNLRVLHWTWRALHERPEELVAQLYAALNLPR